MGFTINVLTEISIAIATINSKHKIYIYFLYWPATAIQKVKVKTQITHWVKLLPPPGGNITCTVGAAHQSIVNIISIVYFYIVLILTLPTHNEDRTLLFTHTTNHLKGLFDQQTQ